MPRRPCLRVGCHNVNGLAAKLDGLCDYWQQQGLDIVAAVDTHVGFLDRTAVERQLLHRGWHSYWSVAFAAQQRITAGVAVLIRSKHFASGVMRLHGQPTAPANGPAQGRLLQVPLEWAGQQLSVVGLYFHASNPAANAAIISGPLASIWQQRQQQPSRGLVFLGDFNFVTSAVLDRRSPTGQQQQQRQAATHDSTPAAAWRHHLPSMCDAWRRQHPLRKAYTFVRANAASRIDRVYVSPNLVSQLAACWQADRQGPVSDHFAVIVQLLPCGRGALGPGLQRLRLLFLSDASCREAMKQWLTDQQQQLPADADTLLDSWFPGFILRIHAEVQRLNNTAKQHRAQQQPAAQRAAAAAAVQAAHQQLGNCSEAAVLGVLAALLRARENLAHLQAADEAQQQQTRRQQWVHSGERPGPAMSRVMRPPKGGSYIRGLHAPGSGHLVRDGLGLSCIVGQHYAIITTSPHTSITARQAVLNAVSQHSRTLGPLEAAGLGQGTVTVEEVICAIRGTAPGKSPGLDGLPGELFRQFREQMAPILASLYSAVGQLHRVPLGFLDGVIIPILKPGESELLPGSYRPIQLLNYVYRILAKILANRLLAVIGHIIHPAQCAFLQHRQIRDSIRLLQILPALLQVNGTSAVEVSTDFTKAYDTVDREFLFAVASQLGVGAGFLSWMRVLLTDTYTCALVNGFKSSCFKCEAGVRQGCPLAPLLYLFIGQALWCFLKQRGVGVTVLGCNIIAAQYADDAEPFVPSLASIPGFMESMNVFADASGQRLNLNKTKLLLIGCQPPVAQDQTAEQHSGLQIVDKTKALGVYIDGHGSSKVDWDKRMGTVKDRMESISRIPCLSAFGRAFALNAYALSTILYAAQFACELPHSESDQLRKWSSALIDAGVGPKGNLQRPPGVPGACMAAHPQDGGFGLLPLHHHLLSRWASEGADLLCGNPAVPWIALGRELWQRWASQVNGTVRAASSSPWGLLLCGKEHLLPEAGQINLVPQPLRAMALGLRALPPLQHVGTNALDINSLCWEAPLWGNPVFVVQQQWQWFGQSRQVVVGLECAAPHDLLYLPNLQCLGQAVVLLHELQHVCANPGTPSTLGEYARYNVGIWDAWLEHRTVYSNRHVALQHMQALMALLPTAWVIAAKNKFTAAQQAGRSISTLMHVSNECMSDARSSMCAHLGWQLLVSHHMSTVQLTQLTVAAATKLQRLVAHDAIQPRHDAFVQSIRRLDGYQQHIQLPAVTSVLCRWWNLHVANVYKEAAWRLTLNAFPTAQRMGLHSPCVVCGVLSPDVEHHFWTCPVAVAVRREIESQLVIFGLLPAGTRIPCSAIWLARPPHRRLHRLVWDMVCLAAIHAFEHGRRTAWAVSSQLNVPDIIETVAVRAAKASFWEALTDFAVTAKVPKTARTLLLTQQPFLAWHVVLVSENGLRVIRR